MQMEFLQSEQNEVRRRWILVLVDSADGVTGKTGQTGNVQISKDGGAPAASTNSIVEIDSVNMPGQYYISLAAGELDTLGPVSIYYKASGTLAFHDRGFVTYNDPYAAVGIMASGGSGSSGITKTQRDALLQDFRKILKEEMLAVEEEEDAEEQIEQKDYTDKLDQILTAVTAPEEPEEEIDFSPILEAISNIPKAQDYSKDISKIAVQVNAFGLAHKIDVEGFSKAISDFQIQMMAANKSVAEIEKVKIAFEGLQTEMQKFESTLADQGDMDKRFDAMNSASGNKSIEGLTKTIQDFMIKMINFKYDILKALPLTKPVKK